MKINFGLLRRCAELERRSVAGLIMTGLTPSFSARCVVVIDCYRVRVRYKRIKNTRYVVSNREASHRDLGAYFYEYKK